jgi:hypothetical protein
MRLHDEGQRKSRDENSPGGFLAELGLDILGDFLPDSLVGYIILILVVVFVLVIRSAMSD